MSLKAFFILFFLKDTSNTDGRSSAYCCHTPSACQLYRLLTPLLEDVFLKKKKISYHFGFSHLFWNHDLFLLSWVRQNKAWQRCSLQDMSLIKMLFSSTATIVAKVPTWSIKNFKHYRNWIKTLGHLLNCFHSFQPPTFLNSLLTKCRRGRNSLLLF